MDTTPSYTDDKYDSVMNLPPHLAEKAFRELGETVERRTECLREMRSRMFAEPDVEWVRDRDWFLVAFLRCKKFDVDRAFDMLKNFTAFYNKHKSLLEGRDLNALRAIYEPGFSMVLPGTDRNGRRMGALLPHKMSFSKKKKTTGFSMEDMMALNLIMTDYMLQDPELQVNGLVMIENFEKFSLRKMMKWNKQMTGDPDLFKDMMGAMTGTLPMRMQGIYLMNCPWYISLMMKISRPFMPKKMKNRVHLFGKGDEAMRILHEQVDPANLPPEFGGTLDVESTRFWDNYASRRPLSQYFQPGPTFYRAGGNAPDPNRRMTPAMEAAMLKQAESHEEFQGAAASVRVAA